MISIHNEFNLLVVNGIDPTFKSLPFGCIVIIVMLYDVPIVSSLNENDLA